LLPVAVGRGDEAKLKTFAPAPAPSISAPRTRFSDQKLNASDERQRVMSFEPLLPSPPPAQNSCSL